MYSSIFGWFLFKKTPPRHHLKNLSVVHLRELFSQEPIILLFHTEHDLHLYKSTCIVYQHVY